MLFTPAAYYALLLMAVASFAFNSIKSDGPWEVKVSFFASIFVFLAFCGANALFFGTGDSIFDVLMNSFNNGSCYLYYGVTYGEVYSSPLPLQLTLSLDVSNTCFLLALWRSLLS